MTLAGIRYSFAITLMKEREEQLLFKGIKRKGEVQRRFVYGLYGELTKRFLQAVCVGYRRIDKEAPRATNEEHDERGVERSRRRTNGTIFLYSIQVQAPTIRLSLSRPFRSFARLSSLPDATATAAGSLRTTRFPDPLTTPSVHQHRQSGLLFYIQNRHRPRSALYSSAPHLIQLRLLADLPVTREFPLLHITEHLTTVLLIKFDTTALW